MTAGEVRKAQVVINLKPRAERSTAQKAFESRVSAELGTIPDVRYSWSQDGQTTNRGFAVILSGATVRRWRRRRWRWRRRCATRCRS